VLRPVPYVLISGRSRFLEGDDAQEQHVATVYSELYVPVVMLDYFK
jgi:hypothetical protein